MIKCRLISLILHRPDGRRYDGGWKEGKQHGRSKYTNKEGVTRIGIWENGRRQGWVEDAV